MTASPSIDTRHEPRGWRSLIGPGIAATIAFAILVGLGTWQVERLGWKEALIARIDARIHAPPQPLPPLADWAHVDPADLEYTHVTATGTFDHAHEAYVFRGAGGTGEAGAQPGYLVMTPLRLDGGGTVLVNRGFVPYERRDPATREQGQLPGEVTVTGLLRAPEGRNVFTPADEPAKRIWYTRDPGAIAKSLGIADPAPFSIDQDAEPLPPGGLPKGGATVLEIPNNHLSYVVTWYGLALTLVGVFVAFARKRLRGESD